MTLNKQALEVGILQRDPIPLRMPLCWCGDRHHPLDPCPGIAQQVSPDTTLAEVKAMLRAGNIR